MQNCLFMNQIEENEKIAKSFSKLKYCGDNHKYQTRSATSVSVENINMKLKSVSMNNHGQYVVEDNLQENLDN